MAPTPLRCLPRSISARADPSSPFISNPAHHQPVSTPAAAAASSFGCMAPTATDSPPDTPKGAVKKHKSTPAFVTFLSPGKLMQRAARAFRGSRSRRRRKFDARDELAVAPVTTSRLSDAASMDVDHRSSNGNNNGAAVDKVQDEMTNHQPPPVAKENNAADEPNKAAGAVREPEEPVDVADKFCIVVKEVTMEKHEEEGCDDTTKEATRVFQGSRVKTAMVARAESEHPRRREVARSNDRIEEACTKLLAKRQGSRVRALVGAFETVMDPAMPAVAKPRHHYSNSF
jgi:hypothetical protein